MKEAGKPDIFLEFKLRKNNKTGEWKAFDMVAEGISLLSPPSRTSWAASFARTASMR